VYARVSLRLPSIEWRLLSTSVGMMFILLVMPGGLGSQVTKLRDLLAKFSTGRRDTAAQQAAAAAATSEVASPTEPQANSEVQA
jgi:hypothetical protein